MGENHDRPVCQWKDSLDAAASSIPTASTEMQPTRGHVPVGDNEMFFHFNRLAAIDANMRQ